MKGLIFLFSLFFLFSINNNHFCTCDYSTSAVCGVLNEESHVFLGVGVSSASFGQYEVKVLEDLSNTLIADTIRVHGADGINCSSLFISPNDTLLFCLDYYPILDVYADEGCGNYTLRYTQDTLHGYIAPGVGKLAYDDFVNEFQQCIDLPTYTYVAGKMTNWKGGGPIANLEIAINGYSKETNAMGRYQSGDVLFNQETYELGLVTPYSNDAIERGLSTLDIVLIQRHLLGIAPFSSPFEYIAADVDGNHMLTTMDMVCIRKVILGLSHSFPIEKSWEFISKGYHFPDPTNPWEEPYPTSIGNLDLDYNDLDLLHKINFRVVKLGDVNGSN